jgi:predicted dehydrogenase
VGGHAFTGHVRLSKTVRLTGGLVVETRDGFLLARESNDTPLRFRPRLRPDLAHDLTSDRDFGYPRGMGVFQRQLRNFVAACRGEGTAAVPVEDGLASLRLIESLYRSREPLAEEPALAAGPTGATA